MADSSGVNMQKAGITQDQWNAMTPAVQGAYQKQYAAAPAAAAASNVTGLSGQIAGALGSTSSTGDATGTPAVNVQTGDGYGSSTGGYSVMNPDGTFNVAGPAFGMVSYLTGTDTTKSGMDPKQLQAALDYINNTGGYNQNVINQGYNQGVNTLQSSGATDLNQQALAKMGLLTGLTVGGQTMSPQQRDALISQMPGYQFQFGQGQRAVESSGASRGLLGSGALLKALTSFGQGLASSNFQQYYGQLATLAGQTGGQAGQLATLQASRGTDLAKSASDASNQYSNALLTGGNKASVSDHFDTATKGFEYLQSLGAHGVKV